MRKKVAIQGIEGSFHHLASIEFFGERELEIIPCKTFHDEVTLLRKGDCDYCLMAMENTLAGNLVANYQLLFESELYVAGEITMHIRQHLIGKKDQKIDDITEIHSHPVALNQCRHFLRSLNGVKLVENEDTALSVKSISETDKKNIAAIGGKMASELYDLEILKTNIEHHYDNYTRFIVLSRDVEVLPSDNKASVYFELKHSVGTLAGTLGQLSDLGVNLTMIHSMPIPKKEWEYGFFVDFQFQNELVKEEVLNYLESESDFFRLLGLYKKGEVIWE